MNPTTRKLWIEIAWWLLAIAAVTVAIAPLYPSILSYPFFIPVIIGGLGLFIGGRYVVHMDTAPWSENLWIRLIIAFMCLPLGFYLFSELSQFQIYLDDTGFIDYGSEGSVVQQRADRSWLRNLTLIFILGGMISCILLPLRILISIWRSYRKAPQGIKSKGLY